MFCSSSFQSRLCNRYFSPFCTLIDKYLIIFGCLRERKDASYKKGSFIDDELMTSLSCEIDSWCFGELEQPILWFKFAQINVLVTANREDDRLNTKSKDCNAEFDVIDKISWLATPTCGNPHRWHCLSAPEACRPTFDCPHPKCAHSWLANMNIFKNLWF